MAIGDPVYVDGHLLYDSAGDVVYESDDCCYRKLVKCSDDTVTAYTLSRADVGAHAADIFERDADEVCYYLGDSTPCPGTDAGAGTWHVDCEACADDPPPFDPCDALNWPDMRFDVNGVDICQCGTTVLAGFTERTAEILNGFSRTIPPDTVPFPNSAQYLVAEDAALGGPALMNYRWYPAGADCGDGPSFTEDPLVSSISAKLTLGCHSVGGIPTGDYEYAWTDHAAAFRAPLFRNAAGGAGVWNGAAALIVTVPNTLVKTCLSPSWAQGGNATWTAVAPGIP